MPDKSRRRFLQLTGATGAGLALGTFPAAAGGERKRFLVDLRQVERDSLSGDLEVVHDLSAIDVLVVRGDPEAVGEPAAVTPDVELSRHDGRGRGPPDEPPKGGRGPAAEHADDDEETDDAQELPDRRALQWDKHAQEMAEEVHPVTEGQGSRLAVIDSGIYDDHPDLDDRVIPGLSKNFTDDGEDYRPNGAGDHGTHVAGIIAATDDYDGERGGVLGTAPKSKLLSLRVFSDTGGASTGDVAAAIMHAADKNCDAANISLGYPVPYVDPEEYPFLLDVLEVYERAVAYANERGTVVVNSAGNDAIDLDPEGTLGVPTEAEGIFAVSATGPIGYVWDDPLDPPVDPDRALQPEYLREPTTQPARYTTYGGSVVDVSAAGGNYDPEALAEADDGDDDTPKWFYDLVISTVTPEDGEPGYGFKAGTSMAAPQVTGAIGLARSLRPQIGVREVEELIRDTADDLGEPDYRGDGHLDVTALVEELARGERGGRGKGRDDDHPGRGKGRDDDHPGRGKGHDDDHPGRGKAGAPPAE